jgi:hypothetical protein
MEPEWRAGIITKKQLAEKFNVSRAAIDKHWAKLGIERDLTARIQQEAAALVTRDAVTREVTQEQRVTEREIIHANAEMQAGVIRAHRKDIQRYRNLCQSLLSQLEAETGEHELFSKIGELLAAPDDKGTDKLNEAYQKAISLPSRIDGVKKLAETLKTLIGLERQAFGIEDRGLDKPEEDQEAGTRDLIESARAIAFTLARASKLLGKT